MMEWGEWECPECRSVQEDPENITVTSCSKGHACILGPIESPGGSIGPRKNMRWAELYDGSCQ